MSYTVKGLAKLSGVSIRALRHYDEIGLLKPAYVGENNYRYYQEEQLLRLQQILFFKELGFELKQIQDILGQSDFDKLKALKMHAKEIKHRMERIKMLSKTIDKTIKYLEGKQTMTDKEMYYGFDSEKQKEYEKWILDTYGDTAKKLTAEAKEKTKGWSQKNIDKQMAECREINVALAQAIKDGLTADSPAVQDLIAQHYQWLSRFYHPTKEVYIGLGKLYSTNPKFRKFYNNFHPELADFLAEAMEIYADKHLS